MGIVGTGNKKQRRTLTFLRAAFQFHAPYRVLLDASFAHLALASAPSLSDALAAALGKGAVPLATRCVVRELREVGETETAAALSKVAHVACAHGRGGAAAAACVAAAAAKEGNKSHLMVGTQDAGVRAALEAAAGVPVPTLRVVGGRGGGAVALDEPSRHVKARASAGERSRRGAQGAEAKVLEAAETRRRAAVASRIAAGRKQSKGKGKGKMVGGGVRVSQPQGAAGAAGKGMKKKKPRHKHAARGSAQ